jgi:hypothetical protein
MLEDQQVTIVLSAKDAKLLQDLLTNLAAGKQLGRWLVWFGGVVTGIAGAVWAFLYLLGLAQKQHGGG